MELLTDPQIWIAFATLTALELVLGIDNIVFISILADRLPPEQRIFARRIGLFLAMFMRVGLLFAISWLASLTTPLLEAFGEVYTGRDLILFAGGAFLIWKSTMEIYELLEGDGPGAYSAGAATLHAIIIQIVLIDAVFSLDSIITAVGLVNHIEVMVAAVLVSVALMIAFAGVIGDFVSAHPSIKMLALAFLFMIGVVLVADGLHHHIPKAYVYSAMAFSLLVQVLNLRLDKRRNTPVQLKSPWGEDPK